MTVAWIIKGKIWLQIIWRDWEKKSTTYIRIPTIALKVIRFAGKVAGFCPIVCWTVRVAIIARLKVRCCGWRLRTITYSVGQPGGPAPTAFHSKAHRSMTNETCTTTISKTYSWCASRVHPWNFHFSKAVSQVAIVLGSGFLINQIKVKEHFWASCDGTLLLSLAWFGKGAANIKM